MKKVEKQQFVSELHGRLEKAQGIFLVGYQGIHVEGINRLRRELKQVSAEFQVVKNRLLKRACEGTETAVIKDQMQGPTAIVVTYEDVVVPAKVVTTFAKDFKQLQIRSGQIAGKALDETDIRRLAELPGRDVLLAQTLSAMQAVPAAFLRVLNGTLTQFLYVLKAIEQQKG